MIKTEKILQMKKWAFTIAEVIIVIGIIGIIAEILLSTYYYNIQKKIYALKLEKAFSEVQSGFKNYMAVQNCSEMTCLGLFNGFTYDAAWLTNFDTAMPKIFKKIQDFGFKTLASSNYSLRNLDGTDSGLTLWWVYAFKVANGSTIGFYDNDAGNCTQFSTFNSKLKNSCMDVYFDINGEKAPNVFGRDVFHFILGNDGLLYPINGAEASKAGYTNWRNDSGICGTAGSATLPSTVTGDGCAARIMEEGWQMNY